MPRAIAARWNLVDGVVTSTYDASNRLVKSEALSGTTTYTYDAAGNRRTVEEPSGDITTSTWDAQNHLMRVELPSDEIVTYTWAPINKGNEERLVQRDDGVDVRRYLWDNNNILRETDDLGAVQTQYTYAAQLSWSGSTVASWSMPRNLCCVVNVTATNSWLIPPAA